MAEINTALLNDFIEESREHLDEMESLLLQLGSDLGSLDILNEIFRTMHNVKGASQMTGLDKVSRLSHRLEDLLDLLRQGDKQTTSEIVLLLISGHDRIVELVLELEQSQQELTEVDDLVDKLTIIIEQEDQQDQESQPEEAQSADDSGSTATQDNQASEDNSNLEERQSAGQANENYQDIASEEKNDEELFRIFLEQIKQQSDRLIEASTQLKQDPNDVQPLLDSKDAVSRLQSSANYMGYDDMVSFFISWGTALDNAQQQISSGEMASLDFIDRNIDDLMATFPQIEPIETADLTPSSDTSDDEDDITSSVLAAFDDDDDITSSVLAAFNDDDDDAQVPSESAAPEVAAPSILGSVNFTEEHDKELFAIYLEHLQEHTSLIKSELIDTLDQAILLRNTSQLIDHLHSSANYMGYEELLSFYQTWTNKIDDAIQIVANGENAQLDFMDDYLKELLAAFPQVNNLDSLKNTKPVTLKPRQPSTTPPAKPEVTEKPADKTPDSITKSEPSVTTDRTDIASHLATQSGTENELAARLNKALKTSLQQTSSDEHDALNDVFDELISHQSSREQTLSESSGQAQRKSIQSKPVSEIEQRKAKEVKDKKVKKTVRVDAEKIDILMNQVGELVVDRSYFFQLLNEMRDLQRHLKESAKLEQKNIKLIRAFTYRFGEAISGLGRTSNELQEGVMKMRMLPVSNLFNRYPRLVHDLTNNTNKKVELILKGEETELDRMIVEELSDPLIHVIRNAIDHGIENTEERAANDKPIVGKLILEAYQESNHIVIQATDDGRGLDLEKIKQQAVSKELYTSAEVEKMTDREIFKLILLPGFSTADKITATSGRGVGMDVVKSNIEKLNGTLDIDSKLGKGTQMRLKIPLTLAIIHALMVRVGSDMFTIPLANVDETVRISQDETSTVEGIEVIYLRNVALPIFRLSTLFKLSQKEKMEKSFVVIVNTDGQRVGFVVDELLGQEEVVIKPLEDYVQEKSGFSGATVVGDGRISLILDVNELVKMTSKRQSLGQQQRAAKLKAIKSNKGQAKELS